MLYTAQCTPSIALGAGKHDVPPQWDRTGIGGQYSISNQRTLKTKRGKGPFDCETITPITRPLAEVVRVAVSVHGARSRSG